MANFVYNVAKGRVAELFNRVDSGDPSTCRLFVIPVDVSGVSDATLKDCDDYAAIITAGAIDRSSGWGGKKVLAAADITFPAPNDTDDAYDLDIADQTWTAVAGSNNSTDLIIGYSSVTSPTNAQIIPLTQHDFVVATDGSDVTAVIDTLGFYRAS